MNSMSVFQCLQVLLVFAKEDAQSDGFWWAADKGGYVCQLSRTTDAALDAFLTKRPHLVVIDARSSKHIDAEALCRYGGKEAGAGGGGGCEGRGGLGLGGR
jgi:putative IMPACT (imprinted ancient) family translation regulator